MTEKPTYEYLKQKLELLEKEKNELKKADETLRESEKRFRNIVEGSLRGVLIHRDHKPLFVNQTYAAILGYTPEEIMSMDSIVSLFSPQDKARLIEYKNARMRNEEVPVDYECQLLHKDGSLIWLDNKVRVIQWEGKTAIQTTISNISKRKQAERILKQHNAYLSALNDITLGLMQRLELGELLEAIVSRVASLLGTEDGYIYLCDDENNYIEMRVGLGAQKAYEGLRLKPGEGVAGTVWETGKPLIINDYASWGKRLQGAKFDVIRASIGIPLKSGKTTMGVIGLSYFEENRIFTEKEASILSQFSELAAIALDNASLYTNLKQELLERQKAENALRESEFKYKILTEHSLAGIYIHQDDKYVFVNKQFADMLGYKPEELLGRKHFEFVHPDQSSMTKERAHRRIAGENVSKRYELKKIRKNGKTVWHEIMASDPIDFKGKPAIMGHEVDISARKRAEAMLKQANEELERRVENRTAELKISNEQLETQKRNLEEVNIALRVLLKRRDEDRINMEQKVLFNMNELVLPYIEKMRRSDLDANQKVLLDILESNLEDITSPFSQSLSQNYAGFTPSEMQIANLIKQGKTSKLIAEHLNLSSRTIETHRKNIRRKLGLDKKKINLRTHLLSIQ